jgi:hypothetical protein
MQQKKPAGRPPKNGMPPTEPTKKIEDIFAGVSNPTVAEFSAVEAKGEAITKEKILAQREDWAKKRTKKNATRKRLGLVTSRQTTLTVKSHAFMSEAIADTAVHFILNSSRSDFYKDGADIAPRVLLGIPAYNKMSLKNAFEHLQIAQEKLKTARATMKQPEWIILSNDTSIISDRTLIARLKDLRETTHVAGAFGMEHVGSNGKWWQVSAAEEGQLRGCYVQAEAEGIGWDYVVGPKFRDGTKWRVLIVHGPFLAIRGDTFIRLNFDYMAANVRGGWNHWMADISMQVYGMKHMAAAIKTHSMQYHNMALLKDNEDFIHDQTVFNSRWQEQLPRSYRDQN